MTIHSISKSRGVSLIEVMVAVLVLSIGLLGMASLMGVSLRNTQSANYRTQAANLAYEFVDTARANILNVGVFARTNWTTPSCDPATAPSYACGSGAESAACDRDRVVDHVCRTLPNGRIRAAVVPAAGDPTRLTTTVDICWTDDRSQTSGDCDSALANPDESGASSVFRLVTEL
ncbi:MAG: hypothetical protein BWZ07_01387 [Alphaproteobacteria bacterium ADurb.BinA280]|nr:type IV pilus modification protein PilV [Xanthomonadales bacterium]MCC6507038.1 type IV pilus modification protein PilV [Aquimonas sp.]OPZ12345.1 MAG: hypothetical protein BWZ07_01387 [Alphaproteobacteria bacterium ADurb.BinA280]